MVKKWPKMVRNCSVKVRTVSRNGPRWPQNDQEMFRKYQEMTGNGLKYSGNGPRWSKNSLRCSGISQEMSENE